MLFRSAGVEAERQLVEELSDATVAAVSTWGDPETEAERHGLPAANVFHDGGPEALLAPVLEALDRSEVGG